MEVGEGQREECEFEMCRKAMSENHQKILSQTKDRTVVFVRFAVKPDPFANVREIDHEEASSPDVLILAVIFETLLFVVYTTRICNCWIV
jgi:hypothetical protein